MKEQLLARWGQLEEWLHGRELRERVIVMVAILVSLALIWFSVFQEPHQKMQKRFKGSIASTATQIAQLGEQKADLLRQLDEDPNVQLRQKISQLSKLETSLSAQINELAAGWISPQDMSSAVRSMLSQRGKLRLVSLKSDPPKSLEGQSAGGQSGASVNREVYLHGLEMVVEGAYFDVLAYLEALESIPWRFHWEMLGYQVEEYPNATVTLQLQTYSAERGWIGV